jgi:hypothetical protein
MRENGLVCLVCKGQRDCPRGAAGAGSPFRALFFLVILATNSGMLSVFTVSVSGFWLLDSKYEAKWVGVSSL